MSLGSPARSTGSTTGSTALSASAGAALTLAAFVVVFAAFVLAPFVLLAAALLLYVAFRPRDTSTPPEDPFAVTGTPATARHHFGSGAR